MPQRVLKCARCGGPNFEPGTLSGLAEAAFRPDNLKKKFLMVREATPVRAFACLDCGSLQLEVDASDVVKLVSLPRHEKRRGFPVIPKESNR